MTPHEVGSTYKKYFLIWAWLVGLLMAGTYISYLPLSKRGVVGLILLIALTKAILVSLFYMHLKFEKIVPLWVVAISPFFLIGLATFLIMIGICLG